MFVISNGNKHVNIIPISFTIDSVQISVKQSVDYLGFSLYSHHIINEHVSTIA